MNTGDLSKLIDREDLKRAIVNIAGSEEAQLSGDVRVESGTSGFEGFLSIVLRVKVSFTTRNDPKPRTESLFVKCLPREKFQMDIVRMTNVFSRESVIYGRVLPLMKQAAAGRLDIPLPHCYHAYSDGINDVIYLEDLVESGYCMSGQDCRTVDLDWEHGLMVVRKLGVLHALTMAAERLLPPGKDNWVDVIPVLERDAIHYVARPGEPEPAFKGVAEAGNEIVVEVASKLPGIPKLVAESGKLRDVLQRIWPVVCELTNTISGGHNVLGHGDCWPNNCMFKYEVDDDGRKRPVAMKFVDLQLAKYCHPSIDLLFFMYLGLNKSCREKYYSSIIHEYYSSLQNSLRILKYGSPPFSLEEFTSDIDDVYKPYGVYFCAVYLPSMRLGEDFIPKNAEDMTPELFESIVNTGNVTAIRERLESDPLYRSMIEGAVTEFVEMAFPEGSIHSSPFLK